MIHIPVPIIIYVAIHLRIKSLTVYHFHKHAHIYRSISPKPTEIFCLEIERIVLAMKLGNGPKNHK